MQVACLVSISLPDEDWDVDMLEGHLTAWGGDILWTEILGK